MFRMLLVILVLAAVARAAEPSTAQRLIDIDQLIKVDCPASSTMVYPDYWPYGSRWDQLAKTSWEQNQPALDAARRLVQAGGEPTWQADPSDFTSLNHSRNLAITIADAALYQHSIGDEAGAFASADDLLELARLLRRGETDGMRLLVAAGLDAVAANRIQIMASQLKLGDGAPALGIPATKAMIENLLDQGTSYDTKKDPLLRQLLRGASGWNPPANAPDHVWQRFVETINRANAERTLAAMSLACHLYRHGQGRWPAAIQHLVPAYLPKLPIDPWGDGKQTFGYVVIKAGLPDGGDRPLVYCRCTSRDGLSYRIDGPQFGFYVGDGVTRGAERHEGGQFRDVTFWPAPAKRPLPTTRPLQ